MTGRQEVLTDAVQRAVERAGVAQTPDDAASVAASVMTQVKADPVLKNQMGLEHPLQSRVQWAGSGGVLLSLIGLLRQANECGIDYPGILTCYNWEMVGVCTGTLVLAVTTLWARFWPGLRPLFSGSEGE